MIQGKSIVELATEIEKQAAAKKDYIAPTGQLRMVDGNRIDIKGVGAYDVTPHAHNQIGERIGIPAKYYERMRLEAPALLADNVNHWFQNKPEKRMLRTMTLERPTLRAVLSERYRLLDHFDLATAILPSLMGSGVQIASSEITERKLYIKWTTPRVVGEVKKGDLVQAGGIITNSEIGLGALSVQPFLVRLACVNGMVVEDFGQKRRHVGRAGETEEDSYELYSDDTLRKDDAAFWGKVRDTVRAVVDQTSFDKLLTRMRESTEQKIEGDIPQVVEVVAKRFALQDGERKSILQHLVSDGVGLTAYGLVQAITSAAGEAESYDRGSEIEVIGGRVLCLPASEWKEISKAA